MFVLCYTVDLLGQFPGNPVSCTNERDRERGGRERDTVYIYIYYTVVYRMPWMGTGQEICFPDISVVFPFRGMMGTHFEFLGVLTHAG